MTVFIPYLSPLMVARCLDKKRLNRQIQECGWIIKAALSDEPSRTKNHPSYKMWKNWIPWLQWYQRVLACYRMNGPVNDMALVLEGGNNLEIPDFMYNEDLLRANRCQLYHKDPVHYSNFAEDKDFTDSNWYYVDGQIIKYKQR